MVRAMAMLWSTMRRAWAMIVVLTIQEPTMEVVRPPIKRMTR
jgi:hypothetical protein